MKMKKRTNYILLLAAIVSFGSCNKLDLKPETKSSDEDYWNTESDLRNAANRMKQQLRTGILHVDPQQKLDEGTLKGDLHRAWIAIREALSKSTDHSVLDECARGEKYLSDRYSTVLEDKATPPATLPLLREQASKVAVTRSTIDTLSRTTKEVKDKA